MCKNIDLDDKKNFSLHRTVESDCSEHDFIKEHLYTNS